jgi:hypothetical protein
MPVRQIKMNYRNVTGVSPSNKNNRLIQFESTLEHAAITIFEFDFGIPFYEEQPLTVFFQDNLSERQYTPDFLVKVEDPDAIFKSPGNYLIEIKHRSDLKKDWAELKPKFRAAIKYAKRRGMKFKILTEVELRTDYFRNILFLKRYAKESCISDDSYSVMNMVRDFEPISVNELLKKFSSDKWYQAEVIPHIWNHVYDRHILVDLSKPLTMSSILTY